MYAKQAMTANGKVTVTQNPLSLGQIGESEGGRRRLTLPKAFSEDKLRSITIGTLPKSDQASIIAMQLSLDGFGVDTEILYAKIGLYTIVRIGRRQYIAHRKERDFYWLPLK